MYGRFQGPFWSTSKQYMHKLRWVVMTFMYSILYGRRFDVSAFFNKTTQLPYVPCLFSCSYHLDQTRFNCFTQKCT